MHAAGNYFLLYYLLDALYINHNGRWGHMKKTACNNSEPYLPSLPLHQEMLGLFYFGIFIFILIRERFDGTAKEGTALKCCASGNQNAPLLSAEIRQIYYQGEKKKTKQWLPAQRWVSAPPPHPWVKGQRGCFSARGSPWLEFGAAEPLGVGGGWPVTRGPAGGLDPDSSPRHSSEAAETTPQAAEAGQHESSCAQLILKISYGESMLCCVMFPASL